MVQLCPDLNLRVDLIEIVYHLHLSNLVVADRSFAPKRRLMHHLHSELGYFTLVELRFIVHLAIFEFLAALEISIDFRHGVRPLLQSNYFLYFAVRASAYVLQNNELVDKLAAAFFAQLDLISVVHRFAEELGVRGEH